VISESTPTVLLHSTPTPTLPLPRSEAVILKHAVMLGHACPARACQSRRTPHLPSLLRCPRGPELHLDMPSCAWPALSPNCRGRGAVVGPVQTGDPELHVCRAQPPSPPAFKPSSERERARSSSGEPCPDSSLILKPIVHPPDLDSPALLD
jgi:hypothetical protein